MKLVKEGCLKFVREFEEIAGFNPLIQSFTIASACNHFWRKEKLQEDLIALEPQGGWHGNHINQSHVALQWLYFQDHLRGGIGRVRHVRKGEKSRSSLLQNVIMLMAMKKNPTPYSNFTGVTITDAHVVLKTRGMWEEIATMIIPSTKYTKPPWKKPPCYVKQSIPWCRSGNVHSKKKKRLTRITSPPERSGVGPSHQSPGSILWRPNGCCKNAL